MWAVFCRLKAVKTFVLGDFPIGEECINAAWLQVEMTSLRRILLKKKTSVYSSIFSPWRKQAGCPSTEEISKRGALLIVFLATYGKSGKSICELKAVELPTGLELDKHCGAWLAALPGRPECAAIYKVLKRIAEELPTPEIVLAADIPKTVSLRTLQRYAQQEREALRLGKPIPRKVLRRLLRRCIPQCPLYDLI